MYLTLYVVYYKGGYVGAKPPPNKGGNEGAEPPQLGTNQFSDKLRG